MEVAGMTAGALDGIRVLDFGQYLSGPLAAVLLADQGAEVIRIEPSDGPRWQTPVNEVLHRHRRIVSLDLNRAADRQRAVDYAMTADVVIENFRAGVMSRWGLGPEELLGRNPRLIYCSLPGFGADDPRADVPGWEGVVLAASGSYATGSHEMLQGEWWPTTGPAFTPLMLASVFGGMLGAVGVTAALIARERDGLGQHVEVPLHDAFFEAIGARALRYERNTPSGALLGSGFYRCADGGYVSLITVWHRHLEWFLEAAGVQSWLADGPASYASLMTDEAARTELHRRLVELLATRPAREWEELGRSAGVPIAALRHTDEWLQEEQAVASGSMVATDDGRLLPGRSVRIRDRGTVGGRPFEAADLEADGPLAGVRVLDLTRVLAAPTVARILAELGADVVKADLPPGEGRAGLREPFFHEAVNRGKRMVLLDAHADTGAQELGELTRWADVLVTNFTMPTLRRMGIDDESLRETAPHLVHAYINAFGTTGPWAELRGYAEIANTVTGITARTMGEGPPSGVAPNIDLPRTPFTDYTAGVLGAYGVLAALLRRARTGHSSRVESSLLDAATIQQLQFLVGDAQPGAQAALGWSALQRLYATQDGWVFVGVAERLRSRFLETLGLDPTLGEPGLEDRVSEVLSGMTSEQACQKIARAGGGAHALVALDELLDTGSVADLRGLRLEQTSEEFGKVVQPGPVIRLSRTPMRAGALPTGGEPVAGRGESTGRDDG